jgi:endonuclease G
MSNKFLFLFALCFSLSQLAYASENCHTEGLDQCSLHSRPAENCNDVIYGAMPEAKKNQIRLCRHYYFSMFNTNTKDPDWVAYHLLSTQLNSEHKEKRKDYFCPDPCLEAGQRAELTDYAGAYPTYNRGHMTPATDHHWNSTAYQESFYLSNMVPQNPDNNGHIWQALESQVDTWTRTYSNTYIVAGPVYDYAGITHQVIGQNNIWAPAALFKIIYIPSRHQAISFIIPNKNIDPKELAHFATSIDHINEVTGLNLFADLPDEVKAQKNIM